MGRHMDITVALCTYNRCDSLAAALESVAVSRLPQSVSWEILVVDNNSTDQTREVVERFASSTPIISDMRSNHARASRTH